MIAALRSPAKRVMTAPVNAPAASPRADDEAAWTAAEAELQAAVALRSDGAVDPRAAAIHVLRAWDHLARIDDAPRPSSDARAALQALDAALLAGTTTPTDATMADAIAELAAAVATSEATLFGEALRRARRGRVLRRLGIAVAAGVPIVAAAAVFMGETREGPWRAQYYPTADFSGEPEIRRDGDIKFDWGRKGPFTTFPDDDFSARWDTCLTLDADTEVAFELVSDDGSRLLVDGTRVVDNWGTHGRRSRGKRVELEAGVHHLRVEYFEKRSSALVSLTASFAGEVPAPIPTRMLTHPPEDADASDPCRTGRSEDEAPEPAPAATTASAEKP